MFTLLLIFRFSGLKIKLWGAFMTSKINLVFFALAVFFINSFTLRAIDPFESLSCENNCHYEGEEEWGVLVDVDCDKPMTGTNYTCYNFYVTDDGTLIYATKKDGIWSHFEIYLDVENVDFLASENRSCHQFKVYKKPESYFDKAHIIYRKDGDLYYATGFLQGTRKIIKVTEKPEDDENKVEACLDIDEEEGAHIAYTVNNYKKLRYARVEAGGEEVAERSDVPTKVGLKTGKLEVLKEISISEDQDVYITFDAFVGNAFEDPGPGIQKSGLPIRMVNKRIAKKNDDGWILYNEYGEKLGVCFIGVVF